jgi:hypothetical protein
MYIKEKPLLATSVGGVSVPSVTTVSTKGLDEAESKKIFFQNSLIRSILWHIRV